MRRYPNYQSRQNVTTTQRPLRRSPGRNKAAEIITENANLRESPDVSGEIIREVTLGEKLILRDTPPVGAWYKVFDAETGQEGWLHGNTFKIVAAQRQR